MTHYEFSPDPKTGRNTYVGSWTETPAPPIDLPFTVENLRRLLASGADPDDSSYTHQQIAAWCDRYFMRFHTHPDFRERSLDIEVAEDVAAQWSMYLENAYSLAELQSLEFRAVRLPLDWFADWHAKLTAVDD